MNQEKAMNLKEFNFASEIVEALIRSRNLLGHELSYERGLVDEEEYNRVVGQYLPRHVPIAELPDRVVALALLAPDNIDAELVGAVFGCDPTTAEAALNEAKEKLHKGQLEP